jgi:hypothetical protein
MASTQVFSLLDAGRTNVETLTWSIDPTPTVDFTGGSARLVIRLRSWFGALSNVNTRRYNASDQAIEYPDDRGLDFLPSMVDKSVVFISKARLS